MPRKMILALEALEAVRTTSKSAQVVPFLGVSGLDMSGQILLRDKGGAADAAYAFSRAVPTLVVAMSVSARRSD